MVFKTFAVCHFLFGMVYFSRGPALKILRGVVVNEFQSRSIKLYMHHLRWEKSHPSKPEKNWDVPYNGPPAPRRLRINTWKRLKMDFPCSFRGPQFYSQEFVAVKTLPFHRVAAMLAEDHHLHSKKRRYSQPTPLQPAQGNTLQNLDGT